MALKHVLMIGLTVMSVASCRRDAAPAPHLMKGRIH